MTPDLFWIPGPWPGRLAVAARPRGGDWIESEIAGLRESGIELLVSLLEKAEAKDLELSCEAEAAERTGLRFISFPIADRGVPASTASAVSLIAAISEALEAGSHVAVHCRQGLGRSGLIAAAVLASTGIDPEQAIATVSAARGQVVPETAEQRSWILQLPASHEVAKL